MCVLWLLNFGGVDMRTTHYRTCLYCKGILACGRHLCSHAHDGSFITPSRDQQRTIETLTHHRDTQT